MGALFTVSYWITLVTVIPGLITLATVWGALALVNPAAAEQLALVIAAAGDWMILPVIVAVMILTQAVGILVEEMVVRKPLMGPSTLRPDNIAPYEQYGQLYQVLARMRRNDDPHGHLRRAVAQFFLTMNTLVAFVAGAITALVAAMTAAPYEPAWAAAWSYVAAMIGCLGISYAVAMIRFREMARSIWAMRRARGNGNS